MMVAGQEVCRETVEKAVTLGAIRKMKHALGLSGSCAQKPKRGKYEAYRNYYACGTNDDADWLILRALGFAERNENTVYWVTESGMKFLGDLLGFKITESD